MDQQNEIKWHQKTSSVIVLLIFFFPIGIYLMWKNELWTKQIRWIVTGIIALLIVINANNNKNDKKSSSSKSESNYNSNPSGSSNDRKMTHRCGRTYNGKLDRTYGAYGDYCCERCYVDFYPN